MTERECRPLNEWTPLDVLQAALESVSDFETPKHAREMAEDMLPTIRRAGWGIMRVLPCLPPEGGAHG